MKIAIFRNSRPTGGPATDDYSQELDSVYADRVLASLRGQCTACGQECVECRSGYGRRPDADIAVVELPAVLPYLLEDPGRYVPRAVPPHDVLIAINIHEQVLLEVLRSCRRWGTRGVVVPLEAPAWVGSGTIAEAERICQSLNVEIAFPKPFCTFSPRDGILAEFRKTWRVGYPDVELELKDGRIAKAYVNVSAPCGATYYVARWLLGKNREDDLKYDVISRRLHSFPCTASMAWDDTLGDTVMHQSGKAHFRILEQLGLDSSSMPQMHSGLPKPVPVAENVKKIADAAEMVLKLAARKQPLDKLHELANATPAALNCALILLRNEGRIRIEDGIICLC